MRTISEAEIDVSGPTMVVRYSNDAEAGILSVGITAQTVEGGPYDVERCEVVVITSHEPMTGPQMKARVEAEGDARSIDCVAWIEEPVP